MNNWGMKGAMAAVLAAALLQTACAKPAVQESSEPVSKPITAQAETMQQEQVAAADKQIAKETKVADKYQGLVPFRGVKAPEITEVKTVNFQTSQGDIVIEIYPQAAPNAAKRFLELVEAGFYDNTPVFRVVRRPRPFVAQFGINWRPGKIEWREKNFKDDPSLFELQAGTLAFAKAGPNTNSTQVFINYGDNNFLRDQVFTTFGRIVKGMEIANNFKEIQNNDMSLDQGRLWFDGEAYMKSIPEAQRPTMIVKATIAK